MWAHTFRMVQTFTLWWERGVWVWYQVITDLKGHSKITVAVTTVWEGVVFVLAIFFSLKAKLVIAHPKWPWEVVPPGKFLPLAWVVLSCSCLWVPMMAPVFPIWFSNVPDLSKNLCKRAAAWCDPHSIFCHFRLFHLPLKMICILESFISWGKIWKLRKERGGILAGFSVESHFDSSFLLAMRMRDVVIETDFLGKGPWPWFLAPVRGCRFVSGVWVCGHVNASGVILSVCVRVTFWVFLFTLL